MLTDQEERRLYDAIPTAFTTAWGSSNYSYSADLWWSEENHDIAYPEIVLSWNVQGARRDAAQPMNRVIRIDEKKGQPTVDEEEGTRVFDEMVVQTAVSGHVDDNGVPAQRRASALTDRLVRFFRYDFDQNSEGPNGERPVVANITSEPTPTSGQVDGDRSVSYQFTVELLYTERDVTEQDAVDTVSGEADVGGDGTTINEG